MSEPRLLSRQSVLRLASVTETATGVLLLIIPALVVQLLLWQAPLGRRDASGSGGRSRTSGTRLAAGPPRRAEPSCPRLEACWPTTRWCRLTSPSSLCGTTRAAFCCGRQ